MVIELSSSASSNMVTTFPPWILRNAKAYAKQNQYQDRI